MAYLRGITTPPRPPVPYTPWKRVKHLFHSWDGSVWDVTDGRDGVFLMPEGIAGMGMPDIENFTFSSPVTHGVEWEGWRATGREVSWVIGIFEDTSEDWLNMKTEFWKMFRPGKTMRWEVILPNNKSYNLTVRFKDDTSSVYSRDPVRLGWAIYGIRAFPEQPFWEGEPISDIWFPAYTGSFFGTGFGPPFTIGSTSDITNAVASNPGDVETYIQWELMGPFSSATVGINEDLVTVGNTLAGQIVLLDTNPTKLTATRDGVDIMTSLGSFDFAPLPPGEEIRLNLAMTGTGSIKASYTPLYLRSI